jgi:hypothetical protein
MKRRSQLFIPYADYMRVVAGLVSRPPRDSWFGFNENGTSRARVMADAEIDLEHEVLTVLRELAEAPEPRSS